MIYQTFFQILVALSASSLGTDSFVSGLVIRTARRGGVNHLLSSDSGATAAPDVDVDATDDNNDTASNLSTREGWIQNSLSYYNRVTRGAEHVQSSPLYLKSAMDNYFAREKIKNGQNQHAESIYRRLMEEMTDENKHDICDFSSLAVPTLLLGLLLQREGRFDDARTVFEGFSHVLDNAATDHQCCCSARVLQAHALFEMKQQNGVRALEIIQRAIGMDDNLSPVLQWKQFQDARRMLLLQQQQQHYGLGASMT
mmetsp:Transcript_12322/g.34162  ORF Transcript_12322/g.34162 Transcript_12322/m.34162 type:complete len:255 (+) Transcript_12322:297-1061(+)|eukprot:CAMPEP_0168760848 /NCGR_PEP_ID=MMETSP0724-20121128/22985_1 /TAXON_ID=265536 /ORGANISM="Amphiprora sp., Strain CCMP467" /LENGTH=254 /DNA_ID=CAMNT_0008809885 /DNA_START=184 /DNA_END=948 /DNA_ORIENTATION=+